MTTLSRLIALFPGAVIASWLGCLLWLVARPGLMPLVALLFAVYGLPLLCYRLHALAFPMREGASNLAEERYSPWWGGHQLQLVYIAFPAPEMVLRLIPGAFSLWLRLWGSSVGRRVYWTPQIEVVDRGLLDVGDDVIVGHRVGFYPHLIKPTRKSLLLFVKRITVGSGAFIGANTALTPGVVVAPGAVIEMGSRLKPKERVGFEDSEA